MSSITCPRAWEAEAIQDGRLDELGAASFERHIAQCGECAREAAELRGMRQAFEGLEPRKLSLLEQRRQRAELLRRANERVVAEREVPRRSTVKMAAMGAFVALVLGVIGIERWHGMPTLDSAAPGYELRAFDGATFHDQTTGSNGRVALSSGSLAVHVEHLRPGQSFILAVPDGELGVRGTRFIVDVSGGHTERVLVTEGMVAVRLSGFPERTLAAGESWTRPRPAPAAGGELLVDVAGDAVPAQDATSGEAGATARHQPTSAVKRTEHGRASVAARPGAPDRGRRAASDESWTAGGSDAPAPPSASTEQATPSPSLGGAAVREFAAAMAALDAGAYLDADERLSTFAARFPSDARREDAAFLRAVIAVKRGDPAAAVARARDYLKTFPHGLRRVEMEHLMASPQ